MLPMPLVELPLNATEDRLVGTLHIEHALRTGARRFEPGLLAAAHRGLLYVDEVNLLDDHLVDMLLDAAATGYNQVEREGISEGHPAQFILVGTMNPEEGELRPQFLDRFGLCVSVEGISETAQREQVVSRRLGFEAHPERFIEQWATAQQALAARIIAARRKLAVVRVPEPMLSLAVRIAVAARAHGHRADLTILKAARALAALLGKDQITGDEIAEAAHYVLPHRVASEPFSSPEAVGPEIERLLEGVFAEPSDTPAVLTDTSAPVASVTSEPAGEDDDWQQLAESIQVPGAGAAGSIIFALEKKSLPNESSKPTN